MTNWLVLSAVITVTVIIAQAVGLVLMVINGWRNRKKAVGVFHPYTNDGGGGERVLWCAVKAIQDENPNLDCVIYTGDHDASPDSLTGRALDRFGVRLIHPPKVMYYTLFSWMYNIVGSCAHLAMVNSSWTESHIEKLWGIRTRIRRVYPPCDTSRLQALPLEKSMKPPKVVSVAQFRPEKAHPLQLEAFAVAIKKLDQDLARPKIQLVGSCRNEADEKRLQNLEDLAIKLNVDDHGGVERSAS
ncbi:hypothetical protein RND71_014604 [Anisodus tanguticus]|uniref:ALG11 mannosyltransferase N-terminal domain-containing protein n=1 Tax=Anisodus tanguticus TaxID=243964 RepID=A0AAE1SBX1_9SOLA|nr:hypothetical protein RND71_014604 [Anisodus tanguticus]